LAVREGLKLRLQLVYGLYHGRHALQLPLILAAKNSFYDFTDHLFPTAPLEKIKQISRMGKIQELIIHYKCGERNLKAN
jgi:hypothetical protein